MKHLVLMMTLAFATTAYAQPKKNTQPAAQPVAQTYSAPSTKVFGANFGMRQSAFNLGLSIDSGANTGDLGGSIFMQTGKDESNNGTKTVYVHQVLAFGAHVVVNVFDSNGWVLDLRPGVGIAMVSDITKTTGTGTDDKTVFGPTFRWSLAKRLASGNEIGVERIEVWNWFEKAVSGEDAYTSLVFRTRF